MPPSSISQSDQAQTGQGEALLGKLQGERGIGSTSSTGLSGATEFASGQGLPERVAYDEWLGRIVRRSGRSVRQTLVALALLETGGCAYHPLPNAGTVQNLPATILGTFLEHGLYVRWNYATKTVAYQKQGANGYYNVYLADEDGRNERPLTVDHPGLPKKHAGAHDWHPSGKYLVFVAEKAKHEGPLFGLFKKLPVLGESYAALPGFGGYSDLWLITRDGSKVWQLTNVPNDYDHGTLLPNFSRDGKKLTWAERVKRPQLFDLKLQAASWVIKVADFVEAPEPHLENVRTYQPGGDAFYEVSAFTPDGAKVLFTSSFAFGNFWKSQIHSLDLVTETTTQLTTEGYNEHPSFSPDAKTIIYMSEYQSELRGTDWWLMNADGTNKRRITFMNQRGHPHSNGQAVWAGTVAWSPDGKWFYGDVQTNLITQEGQNIKVALP